MIYLSEARDWVRTLGLFDGYWIGRLSVKRENTLGVYPLRQSPPRREVLSGSERNYDVTGIHFLIHGGKNKDEAERLAWDFFHALENRSAFIINGKTVYFIRLLYDGPIDVDSDHEVYEYTVQAEFISERNA